MFKVLSFLALLPFIQLSESSEATNSRFDFPVLEQHVLRGIGLSFAETSLIGCGSGCENGGVCIDNICNCTGTGHEGEMCKNDINECDLYNPCSRLEICQNTKGSYRCESMIVVSEMNAATEILHNFLLVVCAVLSFKKLIEPPHTN